MSEIGRRKPISLRLLFCTYWIVLTLQSAVYTPIFSCFQLVYVIGLRRLTLSMRHMSLCSSECHGSVQRPGSARVSGLRYTYMFKRRETKLSEYAVCFISRHQLTTTQTGDQNGSMALMHADHCITRPTLVLHTIIPLTPLPHTHTYTLSHFLSFSACTACRYVQDTCGPCRVSHVVGAG